MVILHETDKEFLDEISEKSKNDPYIQLLLDVIVELNSAVNERRPIKENYLPMLSILLAAHGTVELDMIRFASKVSPNKPT